MDELLTADALFDGKITVYQGRNGYRFSLDAVLLAGLTRVKPDDGIIDLGAGCGVIPLILAYRKLGRELVGVEIQEELAELARRNVDENGFSDRVRIMRMDFQDVSKHFRPQTFDLAISNPPYRRVDSGRINPNRQRAIARHEIAGSAASVFAAGKYLLPQGGRLAVIYPAERLDHLIVTARQHGFSPKVMTIIHSNLKDPARLVHGEFRKGGGEELRIGPPFLIYREDGTYTDSMQKLYDV